MRETELRDGEQPLNSFLPRLGHWDESRCPGLPSLDLSTGKGKFSPLSIKRFNNSRAGRCGLSPSLLFFLLSSFPSFFLSHYTLRDKGAEAHARGCLQNCENPCSDFFFYCHDFDRDRKRSIWNELEPTTWRQPNHKIKLWDYQNLGRKNAHFQTYGPLTTPPNKPPKSGLIIFPKQEGGRGWREGGRESEGQRARGKEIEGRKENV